MLRPRIGRAPSRSSRAKTVPAHRGLRPESPLALSRGLPIQRVLAAPRFALSTILARTARAFHHVRRSKDFHVNRSPGYWRCSIPASKKFSSSLTIELCIIALRRSTLPCRARTGLQAGAARPARAMAHEFPVSPPSPSPEGRGEMYSAEMGCYPFPQGSIGEVRRRCRVALRRARQWIRRPTGRSSRRFAGTALAERASLAA